MKSLFFILSLYCANSLGASCCGGGASLPNLILGDYKAQMGISGFNSAVTHRADSDGEIYSQSSESEEVKEGVTIKGAYLYSEYLQFGAELPLKLNTTRSEGSSSNKEEQTHSVGDIRVQAGYEFMPELYYSKWKPRGFIFAIQSFPTAKSIYDHKKIMRTDSMGRGFYTTTFGMALTKNMANFDWQLMSEVHKGLPRRFKNESGETISVDPKHGYSAQLSIGHSIDKTSIHIGSSLLYAYEDAHIVSNDKSKGNQLQYYVEAGVNISYLYSGQSFALSYSDQSLLGRAKNTTLTKSLAFSYLKFVDL